MGRKPNIGIRRTLFGYRRSAVHELLLECDYMQRNGESNVLAAEARIAELQASVDEMAAEVARRDGELRSLEEEVARLEDRAVDGDPIFVTSEVDTILTAAQEAASRIVERAKSVSERINESNRREDRLRSDVARLTAWREEALPVIRSVRSFMEVVRADLDQMTGRIVETLAPLEDLAPIDDVLAAEGDKVEDQGDRADGLRIVEPKRARRSRAGGRSRKAAPPEAVAEELTG